MKGKTFKEFCELVDYYIDLQNVHRPIFMKRFPYISEDEKYRLFEEYNKPEIKHGEYELASWVFNRLKKLY